MGSLVLETNGQINGKALREILMTPGTGKQLEEVFKLLVKALDYFYSQSEKDKVKGRFELKLNWLNGENRRLSF